MSNNQYIICCLEVGSGQGAPHCWGHPACHPPAHCSWELVHFAQILTFFEVCLPPEGNNEANGLFHKLIFFGFWVFFIFRCGLKDKWFSFVSVSCALMSL